ncbi:MAG: hypothetical protein DM484_19375, partial [Candidatus Methylumidiphilus alinenensis]
MTETYNYSLYMVNIDFSKIAARCGSQPNAFEELCTQLARRVSPVDATFERFRGAGGDGGVECITHLSDGSIIGWQAKFVFDVEALIKQASDSLQTALSIHNELNKYVVCFPFDRTGKTARTTRQGRPAKSDAEKLTAWINREVNKAKLDYDKDLKIELWSSSELISLLFKYDESGGIRQYFFDEQVLSTDWFKNHITSAIITAGPRYTPKLNITTELWCCFSAFERSSEWQNQLKSLLAKCHKVTKTLNSRVKINGNGGLDPEWPETELENGTRVIKECEELIIFAEQLVDKPKIDNFHQFCSQLKNIPSDLSQLECNLAKELDTKHGNGISNSKKFRTFMAEYNVSFPAANLDTVREVLKEFTDLAQWANSPKGYLAFKQVFILSGVGGSGKTHGICDMALNRLDNNGYTCVLFGHQFGGQPAEWTRLIESLGLSANIKKESILDALNAAGEASGKPLIFCIDAVNETRPRDYWICRFLSLAHEFEQRPFLKLCISCRTSYLSTCLPEIEAYPIVEHQGFSGIERKACNTFFQYFDLEPPLVPILQPELSNPLYLKLVCQTLKQKGLKQLPTGWFGLLPVIDAFLLEKEKQFARDEEAPIGANIVTGSLLAIAKAIAQSGEAVLPWSEAQRVVIEKRPQSATLPVLDWLVKAELLIEDGPTNTEYLGGENVLRPAFERFGEFLIATEILQNHTPGRFPETFLTDSNFQRLFATEASMEENAGLIQALSIILPEKFHHELPNLVEDPLVQRSVLKHSIRALPWRSPYSFFNATADLVRKALFEHDAWLTMDSLLGICAYPSAIDAFWLSDFLISLSIAGRDGFWCGYLHKRYEENGIVNRLIDATTDIELRKLDSETASRWALILLWFTAAADRRIKDHATRGVVAIFRARPEIIHEMVLRLLYVDDDEIRERILLSAYGALIVTRD